MKFTKVFFSVLVMLRTNYIHRDVKRLFRQSLLAKELLRESSHKEELAIKVPFLKTELKLLSTLCTDNSFKKGDIFVVCRMWFLFFRVKSIFIDTRTFALCQRWSWKCSKNFWELGNIFDFIFELKRLNWNLKTRSKQRKKERSSVFHRAILCWQLGQLRQVLAGCHRILKKSHVFVRIGSKMIV